jgi:hypothetical protein
MQAKFLCTAACDIRRMLRLFYLVERLIDSTGERTAVASALWTPRTRP